MTVSFEQFLLTLSLVTFFTSLGILIGLLSVFTRREDRRDELHRQEVAAQRVEIAGLKSRIADLESQVRTLMQVVRDRGLDPNGAGVAP